MVIERTSLCSDRTALLVAFASAAASYLVTGVAHSLPMLFLSRIFCVLMHVMQGIETSDKPR